jgi:hypothetical protein
VIKTRKNTLFTSFNRTFKEINKRILKCRAMGLEATIRKEISEWYVLMRWH